jgi:hypothetical protein
MVLLIYFAQNSIKTDKPYGLIPFSLISTLLIALRTNAFTVVFTLILTMFILKTKKYYRVFLIGVLFFSTFLGIALPKTIIEKSYSPQSFGMLWEMTYNVKYYGNEVLKKELRKYGDIDRAIEIYSDDACNNIIWDNNPPYDTFYVSDPEVANKITKLYINSYFTDPNMIKTKLHFIVRSLGIGRPLITSNRGLHIVNKGTNELTTFVLFSDNFKLGMHPIISFSIVLFICLHLKKQRELKTEYFIVFIVAVSWYAAFFINCQAYELRYFVPSFFLLLPLIISHLTLSLYKYFGKEKI